MNVSKNAYYNWLREGRFKEQKEGLRYLKERIRYHFIKSKEIYGSARIQAMLERESLSYSRSYIASLMREMGLRSILKRKFVITTDSNHNQAVFDNILDRDFSSDELGKKWVSDITYVRVGNAWNYLTTIMDLADRKIVSWHISTDMTTENTTKKAWNKARNNREIVDGFVFHSDRGVQYAANDLVELVDSNPKVTQSMSRKGNCWDNAPAESFFKTIKSEWLIRFKFQYTKDLINEVHKYINWYNYERIHSAIGYLTPAEMEMKLKGFLKNVA